MIWQPGAAELLCTARGTRGLRTATPQAPSAAKNHRDCLPCRNFVYTCMSTLGALPDRHEVSIKPMTPVPPQMMTSTSLKGFFHNSLDMWKAHAYHTRLLQRRACNRMMLTFEQTKAVVTEIAPQRGHDPPRAGRQDIQTQQPQFRTTGSRSSCVHPGLAHRKSARLSRASCWDCTACTVQAP